MATASTSLSRSFTVAAAPAHVWAELTTVTDWPRWATHIRAVTVTPSGRLGPTSQGGFRLAGGMRARFTVTAFDPPNGWCWRGRFLWFTVDYDHRITGGDGGPTEVTFALMARGPLASSLGAAFARRYTRDLDRAISRLVAHLEDVPGRVGPAGPVR